MGGESGGERVHVYIYMAESLRCSPETITILLIGYTPTQNKEFLFCFVFLKEKSIVGMKL